MEIGLRDVQGAVTQVLGLLRGVDTLQLQQPAALVGLARRDFEGSAFDEDGAARRETFGEVR